MSVRRIKGDKNFKKYKPGEKLPAFWQGRRSIGIRLTVLSKRIAKFMEDRPVHGFRPNPIQRRFFFSTAKKRLFLAGNRAGKTTAGLLEDLSWMRGYRAWLQPSHPCFLTPVRPPVNIRMIVQDYEISVKENIEPALNHWLPNLKQRKDFSYGTHNTGALNKLIDNVTGSRIHIISHKQEGKSEGGSFHALHVDEPCPWKIYAASLRGVLQAGGWMWMTMTPALGSEESAKYVAWIHDKLFTKAGTDPNIAIIQGSSYENVGFGISEKGFVDEYAESLGDEDEVKARIYGQFTHLIGLVYGKELNLASHAVKASHFPELEETGKPGKIWPRYIGVDVHPKKGHYAVLMACDNTGKLWAYRTVHATTADDFAEALKTAEPRVAQTKGHEQCTIVIDPMFAYSGRWLNGKDFVGILREHGILCSIQDGLHGPNTLIQGIGVMKNYLTQNLLVLHEDECKPVFHELMRYTWGPGGRPIQKFDDYLDCIRMVLQYGPTFYTSGRPEPQNHHGFIRDTYSQPLDYENHVGFGMDEYDASNLTRRLRL